MSYSKSLSSANLQQLGWKPFFQQQLTLDEWDIAVPARVIEVQRSVLTVQAEQQRVALPVSPDTCELTVGDWVLLDKEQQFLRSLERLSLFSRKAAGSKVERQLIAANVDTVFIVSSLNDDFNLSRIERFLALAKEAQVEPVIVLTKADLCANPQDFTSQLHSLDPMLMIEAVNALEPSSTDVLQSWLGTGKTIAFLGSSGVGKSTLVNTLQGEATQATGSIREDDSKGRHTTTSRSLSLLPSGGLLLDTPGMRELKLADCEQGVEQTFAEISALSEQCRFADCQHNGEPGCAVIAALESGEIDQRRLNNYRKLLREQALNSATLAEKRASDKALGRFYKDVQTQSRSHKGR